MNKKTKRISFKWPRLFSRPKASAYQFASEMMKQLFPEGQADKDALTHALLHITQDKMNRQDAQIIAIRAYIRIMLSDHKFTETDLYNHLKPSSPYSFSEEEIKKFHSYLTGLKMGYLFAGSSPARIGYNKQLTEITF